MNSRNAIWFGGVIVSLLIAGTCAHADDSDSEKDPFEKVCILAIEKAAKRTNSAAAQEALRAMVQFGLDVHGDVLKSTPHKTVVTSPFSIMSMLGMLRNAANGDTASKMQLAMGHFHGSLASFNQGMEELSNSLRTVKTGVMLTFGNMSIVDKNRAVLNPKFKADLQKHFGAAAEAWDFSDPDQLIKDINKYIADNTNQLIPQLLGSDDAPQIWALINAGYFKASWEVEFNLKHTDEEYLFKLGDGSTKIVPMMSHGDATLPFHETSDFKMVSIPYRNADFTMDVIVPTLADGETPGKALERVSGLLNEKNYSSWVKSLTQQKLDSVRLPRWETGSELKEVFKAVLMRRMPDVFSGSADLSAMLESGPGTRLGTVIHATLVKTNEQGSEGAFVTFGGGLEMASANPSISADHPFIAVIRHVSTGIPVFVITEWDPKPMAPPPAATPDASSTRGAKQIAATDAMNRYLGRIEGIDELLEKAYGQRIKRSAIVKDQSADKLTQVDEILVYLKEQGEQETDAFVQALQDNSVPTNIVVDVLKYFGS